MRCIFISTITLAFVAGCTEPPVPDPVLSTNTQDDLRHDHKHFHDSESRHEHEHQDQFSGAHSHSHSHDHGHRHAEAPNGGQVISLRSFDDPGGSTGTPSIPISPHLEIVLQRDGSLYLYFLAEAESGDFSAWDLNEPFPTVMLSVRGQEYHPELRHLGEPGAFAALFPSGTPFAPQRKEAPHTISQLRVVWSSASLEGTELMLYQKHSPGKVVE